jgi:hypothetical protein
MYETPYMLSARDSDILEAVYQFHYLTVPQVTRLIYGTKLDHYTNEQLKRLSDAGYLYRFPLPDSKRGNKQLIATLAAKGIKHLKETGKEHGVYFRPGDTPPSLLHLQHELVLNDFLIVASLLPKVEPSITLAKLLHGWQLRHTPIKVTIKGETISVVGDGWLDFRLQIGKDIYQTAIWVEIDRNSEYSRQFKRKIRGLVEAVKSPAYQELFGTDSVTIAFTTPVSETRMNAMREYVKEVLSEIGRRADYTLFYFTCLPKELDPKTLFTAPVWLPLQHDELVPLLDLSE